MGRLSRAFRADSCQSSAIQQAAGVHESHGERDAHRLFRRFGLVLNVPISKFSLESGDGSKPTDVPFLKISDFFRTLLSKHAKLLFGGFDAGQEAQELCEMFWTRYELHHPEHIIFQEVPQQQRRFVLPLLWHGDKGRGHGKNPVFVCSFESPFGLPHGIRASGARHMRTQTKQQHGGRLGWSCAKRALDSGDTAGDEDACSIKRRKLDNGKFFEAMQHNSRGHTMLTRFLVTALPAKVMKASPEVFTKLYEEVCKDLQHLWASGVEVESVKYRACLIGIKGDYEYLMECGNFKRHHGRVGSVRENAMCPFCMAGSPNVPFENFSESPEWLATENTVEPWEEEPPWVRCPYSLLRQADMFKCDVFHTLKYGFCRDLAASLLIFLGFLGYFDLGGDLAESRSVEARLERAFNMFSLFCLSEGRNTTLKRFSKQNLHRQTSASFPWLGGKGSDTVLVMMFLDFFVGLCQADPKQASHNQLLCGMRQTLRGALDFLGTMHSHDIYLPTSCASFFLKSGYRLLRGYSFLARKALEHDLKLFDIRPKLHMFHHILCRVSRQVRANHAWVLSPAIHNNEANEDFIGRVSRLSRRVSPRLVSDRVLRRYLIGARLAFRRAGV